MQNERKRAKGIKYCNKERIHLHRRESVNVRTSLLGAYLCFEYCMGAYLNGGLFEGGA